MRRISSGEGGIRTLGELAPTLVFETSTIGHSVTSPNSLLAVPIREYLAEFYHSLRVWIGKSSKSRFFGKGC